MCAQQATTRDSVLGYVIRQTRERAGLKQSELAERVGIPTSSLSRIESGAYAVSAANLMQIATVLGTTGADLLTQADRFERQINAMGGQVVLHKEDSGAGAALVAAAVLLGALVLLGRGK